MNKQILQAERANVESMRQIMRNLASYPAAGQTLAAWAEEIGLDAYERIEAEECERAGVSVEQWAAWTSDAANLRREIMRTAAQHLT